MPAMSGTWEGKAGMLAQAGTWRGEGYVLWNLGVSSTTPGLRSWQVQLVWVFALYFALGVISLCRVS